MSWHTSIGNIELKKQIFLHKKKRGIKKRAVDPFVEKTGIINRSYSKRCQRLTTDFEIEESFQKATERMKEHHGVEIPISIARRITQHHAKRAKLLVSEVTLEKEVILMVFRI